MPAPTARPRARTRAIAAAVACSMLGAAGCGGGDSRVVTAPTTTVPDYRPSRALLETTTTSEAVPSTTAPQADAPSASGTAPATTATTATTPTTTAPPPPATTPPTAAAPAAERSEPSSLTCTITGEQSPRTKRAYDYLVTTSAPDVPFELQARDLRGGGTAAGYRQTDGEGRFVQRHEFDAPAGTPFRFEVRMNSTPEAPRTGEPDCTLTVQIT